ncbi:MAG: hypothetical protein V4608_11840 [Bacteroidota bacterium]
MINNVQEEIFQAFIMVVNNKLTNYFSVLGFNSELPFKQESQGIGKSFTKGNSEVNISFSLHHLDYADGIKLRLKSKFGDKYLLAEVQRKSKTQIPVYLYSTDKVNDEMDRILTDFKKHLEKYIT